MKQAHKVATRLPIESDLGADNIKVLSDLINEVYDEAESGMWKRKGTRTSRVEVERLLRARALILAEIDGALVGSVNVKLMDEGEGEFGMLVADREYRGKGIGSALVKRAERWVREHACHTMRLEILTPRHWTHPSKEFLRQWSLQDRVLAPNNRTVRINVPRVSARARNGVRLYRVAQVLDVTILRSLERRSKAS